MLAHVRYTFDMTPVPSFRANENIRALQQFNDTVYGIQNDRFYSIEDALTQVQRFAMRTLKGIRKEDKDIIRKNLCISVSWLTSIANRLHIDLEDELWKRFPGVCPYCGGSPCTCEKKKPGARKSVIAKGKKRPSSMKEYQDMFKMMYPPEKRTLPDAGIHYAEEVGEVSEAIHNYLGQHIGKQFDEIKLEMADFLSNAFAIANSLEMDLNEDLAAMFTRGCHVCHRAPCACSYSFIVQYK